MGQYGKVVLAVTKKVSLKDMRLSENSDHNISVYDYEAVKKLCSNASKSQLVHVYIFACILRWIFATTLSEI